MECEVNGLVSTVQILSNDIRMEFGIKRCGVLLLKRGNVVSSEGAEMPDGEIICEKWISVPRYFRIQQNQGKQDEGELPERISEENKINDEKYSIVGIRS